MSLSFVTALLDVLLPPRAGERLVRTIAPGELSGLALPEDGRLPYHDPRVTALIWEIKYRANKRALLLAGEFLGEHILAFAGEELGKPLLVPVPMHSVRRRKRGYNQTELLCKAALSALRSLGEAGQPDVVDYAPKALVRIRNTAPQQGLERRKRLMNVRGSMETPRPELVQGRVCIVLDDVTTTGATLKEARRALKAAGARRVHLLALAQS